MTLTVITVMTLGVIPLIKVSVKRQREQRLRAPVAQTFLNIPQLQQLVRLDSIITVVDAEQIEKQLKETGTAREQVAMADYLLINKTDLVDDAHLQRVEAKARELNPHAQQFRRPALARAALAVGRVADQPETARDRRQDRRAYRQEFRRDARELRRENRRDRRN